MKGKICVITGANAGIGKATAAGLAARGATIAMICRDAARGEAARKEIAAHAGNGAVHLYRADLADQEAIRQVAERIGNDFSAIDVLINNAAVITRRREEASGGLEMQFAVNHLGAFLLTHLLLEKLEKSGAGRIVNVASNAHRTAKIHFDDLQLQHRFTPQRAYGQSKLANVLFTYELARRLEKRPVTANCLHPGVIATKLLRDYAGLPRSLRFVTNLLCGSAEKGARTSIYLASAPEVAAVTGKYFVACRAAPSSRLSRDREVARRLWEISERLTGSHDASCRLPPRGAA